MTSSNLSAQSDGLSKISSQGNLLRVLTTNSLEDKDLEGSTLCLHALVINDEFKLEFPKLSYKGLWQ